MISNLMKKLLCTLLAAFISNNTMAEWIYVVLLSDDNTHLYVDDADVSGSESGNMIKIWVLEDHEQEQSLTSKHKYSSVVSQYEFDCKEKQMRRLYFSVHSGRMGEGQAAFSDNDPFNLWMPIPPQSVSRILREIVCGKEERFIKLGKLKLLGSISVRARTHEAPDWKSPEWKYYVVDGYDKPVFYYDPTTVQKNDHFRKVWSLEKVLSLESRDNYDYYVRTLFEFDCQKERVKILIYETEPSASNRGNQLTSLPPFPYPVYEYNVWVSLKSKLPDSPWHTFDQEKTLFKVVCD